MKKSEAFLVAYVCLLKEDARIINILEEDKDRAIFMNPYRNQINDAMQIIMKLAIKERRKENKE